ncbi:SAM-dependent methyltransferase [Isoptericola sp. b441]|uniref:SAM-dependent methyltransferase n=1 Tax=Actinotalea lenta TaxID=3064654 RepID=A0ABT9D4P7_9CELL|nr:MULTISPECIES: SAM-dependent methyltransferase [unclassified Isoptericola]MDO8105667.1 SAM-dependent methyltransferase [Isoptericola sp. b441]MDO8122372.1 SAM-dependent methyltransferase [Isoptericola sp. b490]
MDAAALTQLLSPEGWALLGALPPYDERLALVLSERLRSEGVAPDLVAAALTQSRLRSAGRAKFDDFADGMLFTQAGLEQATRFSVAARHAQRYAAAGCTTVADLTCGIGGDSMALAALGLGVVAIDSDELTAALATVNLRHFPEAEVRHGDGLTTDLSGVDGLFADPARRTTAGRRAHDPAAYSPPLDAVLALREKVPALGVKVGPGIPHAALPEDAETQWVSVDRDVVEAGLWFGPLAPEGPGRGALVLRGTRATAVREPADGLPEVDAGAPATYLYEPDGAVIRAGLVAMVAAEVQGRLLDRTIAYVTADHLVPTPLATAYRVLDVMPFGLKRLRTALRERGVGRVTIKKRGTAVVPEQLRRQLDLRGDAEATVVLTRVRGAQQVLLVEPAGEEP